MTQPFHDTGTLDRLKQMAAAPDMDEGGTVAEANGEVSAADLRALQNRVSRLEAAVKHLTRARGGGAP